MIYIYIYHCHLWISMGWSQYWLPYWLSWIYYNPPKKQLFLFWWGHGYATPIFKKPNDLGLTFSGQSCQHQCNRHCSKDPSYADTPLWEVTCSCRGWQDKTSFRHVLVRRGAVLMQWAGLRATVTTVTTKQEKLCQPENCIFLLGQLTRLTCTRSFCVCEACSQAGSILGECLLKGDEKKQAVYEANMTKTKMMRWDVPQKRGDLFGKIFTWTWTTSFSWLFYGFHGSIPFISSSQGNFYVNVANDWSNPWRLATFENVPLLPTKWTSRLYLANMLHICDGVQTSKTRYK